jgi:transcriptional regulator with XRE-family HTH domain
MPRKPLESLGVMVRERRRRRTLREVAREIGVGPATLLRVESGRVPDVSTFGRICQWLEVDPGLFLGRPDVRAETEVGTVEVSAHFRADRTPQAETMQALANMLLLASQIQPREVDPDDDDHA